MRSRDLVSHREMRGLTSSVAVILAFDPTEAERGAKSSAHSSTPSSSSPLDSETNPVVVSRLSAHVKKAPSK